MCCAALDPRRADNETVREAVKIVPRSEVTSGSLATFFGIRQYGEAIEHHSNGVPPTVSDFTKFASVIGAEGDIPRPANGQR
jgi:hypothetical protein